MLKLSAVMLGSENPKALTAFYEKVFGSKKVWGEGDWAAFEVGGAGFCIGPHSEVKGKNKEPGRILSFFETSDVPGEFKRIKGLGVKVIREPYHPKEDSKSTIATFEDPDGNYFQLSSPWK